MDEYDRFNGECYTCGYGFGGPDISGKNAMAKGYVRVKKGEDKKAPAEQPQEETKGSSANGS